MSRQLEERQVRAVYESIETGAHKNAVQQATKLLKRQPNNVLYKALKCFALTRTNRLEEHAEADVLADQVLAARPSDPATLGLMQHTLNALNKPIETIGMFEEAYKQHPQDEELGAQAFMANIKLGNWKPAQLLATRMQKVFGQSRMLWWAVMCAVLQSIHYNAANLAHINQSADPSTAPDVRNLLLGLALRLIERAPESAYTHADRFALWLDILQALERAPEALKLLESDSGKHLLATSPVVQEIRRELVLRAAAWDEEREATAKALREGERSWEVVVSHINAHLYAVVSPAVDTIPVVDPGLPGPPPPWPAPPLPAEKHDELLAAARAAKEFFEALPDIESDRTPLLALLELEKRVRAYEGLEGASVVDVPALLERYVALFGAKSVCVEDVLPVVPALSDEGAARLRAFVEALPVDVSSTDALQRSVTALKIARALAPVPRSAEDELADARRYAKLYFDGLALGISLPRTELQPADELAVLAAQALVGAFAASRDQAHLLAAAAFLETACARSRYAYGLRLCLVRVYRLLGAGAPALAHYRLLGAKQVQTDTLAHFVLARGATFSLAADGDLSMLGEAADAGVIYLANSAETPDMLVKAFLHEKYSQITDFMTFQDRLDCSLQRDLTTLELARMRLTHGAGVGEGELLDMRGVFDRLGDRYDNRDFGVLPNAQPLKGDSFDKQTTIGPCSPGGGWANAFIKLYLRAFVAPEELDRQQDPELLRKLGVELPKQDEPVSARVRKIADEDLAELTDDERAFVAFVADLLAWIEPAVLAAVPNGSGNGHAAEDGQQDDVAERLSKSCEDALARAEALASDSSALDWELLHVATLLHERVVLFSIISSRVKGKKRNDPLLQSIRTLKTRSSAALKGVCAALEVRASREDAGALVERCSGVLPDVDVDVKSTMEDLAAARRTAFEGLARGIARVSLS
ncbi:hypothetical protein AURDEDRAFT_114786 [Auricularia subglabra TFB-10046 SS5]|nr:hypothetical protein AURDEDRAFT_114786 [Auricularia subglabra TFB-10046 SS5]